MARRCAVSGPYTSIYGAVGGSNKEAQPLFLCAGRKKMSSSRTPQNDLQQANRMHVQTVTASLKVAPELAAWHYAPRLEFVRERQNWLSSTLVPCSLLRWEQVHIEYMWQRIWRRSCMCCCIHCFANTDGPGDAWCPNTGFPSRIFNSWEVEGVIGYVYF